MFRNQRLTSLSYIERLLVPLAVPALVLFPPLYFPSFLYSSLFLFRYVCCPSSMIGDEDLGCSSVSFRGFRRLLGRNN